jgi:hypothetical protein
VMKPCRGVRIPQLTNAVGDAGEIHSGPRSRLSAVACSRGTLVRGTTRCQRFASGIWGVQWARRSLIAMRLYPANSVAVLYAGRALPNVTSPSYS